MTKLTKQIIQGFLFVAAMFITIMVSRYFTLDPDVYFPEQVETYKAHQTSLLLHVGGGMVALFLGPFQFIQRLRSKYLKLHKITGRIYALGCVTSACAALAMAPRSHGGFPTTAGLGLLAICWLITITFVITRARQHNIPAHQEWVVRSFALTLAAFSLRMILLTHGILYETEITTIEFTPVYQATAWLCWVPNILIAEWYINVSRAKTV